MSTFCFLQDCCSYLFLLMYATGGLSLRLVSLDVPPVVLLGEDVRMNCTLDLENDELYSVKWYKDEIEFYRYVPRDTPAGQKFEIPGVTLDLDQTVEGNIYLKDLTFESDGTYRCEASGEAPRFQTVEAGKELKVYVFPENGPKIDGSKPRYEVGDRVNVTCTSSPSRPPASLKWYVNGEEAEDKYEVTYPTFGSNGEIQTTSKGLVFEVKPEHLAGGVMKLRCTATLSQSYSMSSEEIIIGEKSKEPPDSPPATLQDGPSISGDRTHYQVGDQLSINCSSAKSRPAPELQWFLNNEKVEDDHLVRYEVVRHQDGQETSSLGLRFTVEDIHFSDNNEMKLKCTATYSKVINMNSDEKTVGGNHRSSGFHVSENGSRGERSTSSRKRRFVSLSKMLISRFSQSIF